MIAIFTDFSWQGPYVGQMKSVLMRQAPGVPVVDLMHDAPSFDPKASAYLLSALLKHLPDDAIILGVVDPGVGGPRAGLVVELAGRRLVGPDNGLFQIALRHAGGGTLHEIIWRPETLSNSFHGRDLFAPVAAALACGEKLSSYATPRAASRPDVGADWPEDLAEVIYVDGYGNCMTGLRFDAARSCLPAQIPLGKTFADVPPGQAFGYENSLGLLEIAVNQGRADEALGLSVGSALPGA